MSIFRDMMRDRPFVLYLMAFMLGVISLIFSNVWFLIPAVAIGMLANYLCHKEDENEKNRQK